MYIETQKKHIRLNVSAKAFISMTFQNPTEHTYRFRYVHICVCKGFLRFRKSQVTFNLIQTSVPFARVRWGYLGLRGTLGLFAFSLLNRSQIENFDS